MSHLHNLVLWLTGSGTQMSSTEHNNSWNSEVMLSRECNQGYDSLHANTNSVGQINKVRGWSRAAPRACPTGQPRTLFIWPTEYNHQLSRQYFLQGLIILISVIWPNWLNGHIFPVPPPAIYPISTVLRASSLFEIWYCATTEKKTAQEKRKECGRRERLKVPTG